MVIFFPSIHPSLLSSCRNASKRTAHTGSSAIIQETYAEDFPWLLRRRQDQHKRKERWRKALRTVIFFFMLVFPCLDPLVTRHLTLASFI